MAAAGAAVGSEDQRPPRLTGAAHRPRRSGKSTWRNSPLRRPSNARGQPAVGQQAVDHALRKISAALLKDRRMGADLHRREARAGLPRRVGNEHHANGRSLSAKPGRNLKWRTACPKAIKPANSAKAPVDSRPVDCTHHQLDLALRG